MTIHDNATLRYAIVCDGAVVKEGVVLEPGVILSFNVVIGQNFTVPSYSKISLTPQPTEERGVLLQKFNEPDAPYFMFL